MAVCAENHQVQKVYVVFKTHLDIGFTDLSSVVERRYIEEFIPKALDLSERLQQEGKGERYVWTTGSWLIWEFLKQASEKDVRRMEEAIRRGDIVWNAVPYTYESEVMSRDLFETALLLSRKLDLRFGKKTIAAKMTDVPGHTRSIVSPMKQAGIEFLHIGVNPASPIPDVPECCLWQAPDGNSVILMYQQDYGSESVLPGGKAAVSINFTGDNHGPHRYEDVKNIYAGLRKRYPGAELVPASFNDIARELLPVRNSLPVVTSEIGDTWIYGFGGAPLRMARFRALSELYSRWIKQGKLDKTSDLALDFALRLGLVGEHTQGLDVKSHLGNWDKYDTDVFLAARKTPPFKRIEESWAEIDRYVDEAVKILPEPLRKEAVERLAPIGNPVAPDMANSIEVDKPAVFELKTKAGTVSISGPVYQMFDAADYDDYLGRYLRARYGWALDDIGKTGIERSEAVSVSLPAKVIRQKVTPEKRGDRTDCEVVFPQRSGVDSRVLPGKMFVSYRVDKRQEKAEIEVTILNKPAVRLPESYWISFTAGDILAVTAEKTGEEVDLMDVVERGNRRMHGIDRWVEMKTSKGTFRITSDAAFLVNVGEAKGLDYSTGLPDVKGGVHFNLSNNLWGTNFSMWNEGSLKYHFTVELIRK